MERGRFKTEAKRGSEWRGRSSRRIWSYLYSKGVGNVVETGVKRSRRRDRARRKRVRCVTLESAGSCVELHHLVP
jgi:hypothetical protein